MNKFSGKFNWLIPNFSPLLSLLLLVAPAVTGHAGSNYATPYYFTTLAGTIGGPGDANGSGSSTRFNAPQGMAIDAAGNIYVADTDNHIIRKITPDGTASTFAGKSGASGDVDGARADARFDKPRYVAVDGSGNLYVTEEECHAIRKVSPDGSVSLFAGDPFISGSFDGTGATARFQYPRGLAVDSSGNVYVAERLSRTIRKISPRGDVSTLAGTTGVLGSADGTGPAASFLVPEGLAIDNVGNLYLADLGNHAIRKITLDGTVTTFAGTAKESGQRDGTGPDARFQFPVNLTADATGSIYVSDVSPGGRVIRKITPTAIVTTVAEIPVSGQIIHLDDVTGLVIDKTGGIYASITNDHLIYKVAANGSVMDWLGSANLAGNTNASGVNARFDNPTGVAVDSAGNVFVADQDNHLIRKITPAGGVTTFAGMANTPGSLDGTGAEARFNYPDGLAIDAQGNLFVADRNNFTIRQITPAGVVTTVAGIAGKSGSTDGDALSATFGLPTSLAVDNSGNIYVAERHQVRKISASGTVSTIAGVEASPTDIRYPDQVAITVDPSGNVYVGNWQHGVIRKIAVDGVITTFVGASDQFGTDDSQGTQAKFYRPVGLAADNAGNIYLVDQASCSIRKITPQGVVTTLAGSTGSGTLMYDGLTYTPGGLIGTADGTGASARFFNPTGIAVDKAGVLYVANSQNNNIRKGQPAGAPVITTQPASQSASAGGNVQFSVTAGGVPDPAYQWYVNSSALNGATSSSLSLANVRSSDAGDYTVVVTNAVGNVTSNKATLTVTASSNPPPASNSGSSGGGALSNWLIAALTALIFTRAAFSRFPKVPRM